MSEPNTSRRNLILGTAGITASIPVATILTPDAVIAAEIAARPGRTHRGPAHDWLGAYVRRKLREDAKKLS